MKPPASGRINRGDEISFSTTAGQSDLEGLRATYDLNHDNVINSADAVWSSLRVWRDANRDGITNSGELVTLASLGIRSLGFRAGRHHAQLSGTVPSRIAGSVTGGNARRLTRVDRD